MTLEELELIHSLLSNYRNYDCCSDMMLEKETDKAVWIIQREIKLKTMDPRKGDDDKISKNTETA